MQLRVTLIAAALISSIATGARAEVVQLIDNTQLNGKIIHYYDGNFSFETSDGQKVELPTAKIKSITFKLPPARAEFSSPEKTFARYKDALVKNDMPRLIDCYALMYQGVMAAQMSQGGGDDLNKMRKELEATKIEIKSSKVTGNNATLKVQRTKGQEVETADVRLVLENGEWKLTP